MTQTLRVLSEDQVKSLYDRDAAWNAVENAYRAFGQSSDIQSKPSAMRVIGPLTGTPNFGQMRVVKGAVVPEIGAGGVLLYSRDYPHLYLWDIKSEASTALIACGWLTGERVALTAALTMKKLARPDIKKIALFGGGKNFGAPICRLVAGEWSNAEVNVVTSRMETATAFAAQMPANVAPATAADAARDADVIITITMTKAPFIHAGMMKPGAILLSMGSPHEVDIAVLHECDALIVDDLNYASEQGDIGAWLKRGELSEDELKRRLRANIGEIVLGQKKGRLNDNERLLAVIQGLTACDVAVNKLIFDRAVAQGVGQVVSF